MCCLTHGSFPKKELWERLARAPKAPTGWGRGEGVPRPQKKFSILDFK